MASKARAKKGKPHSSRQSPGSSQYLSVDDNSSQASWSSEEDHTHLSPEQSWTSGEIDTEGTGRAEFQNETGGTCFENETGEVNYAGESGGGVSGSEEYSGSTTLLEAEFEQLTEHSEEEPPSSSDDPADTVTNLPSPPSPPHTSQHVSPPPHVSPSPLVSPSPHFVSPTSPSPIPSSHASPSPVPCTPPPPDPANKELEESYNPFSHESDESVTTPMPTVNPFEEDEPASVQSEKNSDSELESRRSSTLKQTSTNPFIQFDDLPTPTASLNPFDIPPHPSPSNPFDDDVTATSVVETGVTKHAGAEDEQGWSETSSMAEDYSNALPSLEESHCISLSVLQQGTDSPTDLPNQFDKVSEGDESSRPESEARERSDIETVSSYPSSVDLSLILETDPYDDQLHPQENYYELEVCLVGVH